MSNTVLVVDDEEVLAQAIGQYLQRYGYSVDVKSSGEEALRIIEAAQPEIILLDYRLPRMDGLEVLRRIKDRTYATHIEVLPPSGEPYFILGRYFFSLAEAEKDYQNRTKEIEAF